MTQGSATRVAVKYLVAGTVQGVRFRASTREQALGLGLDGYANNLACGRVEVLAVGTPHAIDALGRWLARGPEHARVTQVQRGPATDPGITGFTTG